MQHLINREHDRYYIGGGNIAGVLNVSPFSTPLQEYLKITGQAPPLTEDEQRFFARRKRAEPYILDTLQIDHQITIVKRNERYTDAQHSYLKAEIDGETADGTNIEAKSVDPRAFRHGGWGEEQAEESIPLYVLAQTQWGMRFNNAQRAIVVPQIGFDDNRILPTQRNDELIQMMVDKAHVFWNEHVLPGIPPPPVSVADAILAFPKSAARAVLATEEVQAALVEMGAIDAQVKALTDRKDLHKLAVQTAMGEADTLISPSGKVVATWKSCKDGVRFKEAEFKAANPAMYDGFCEVKKGHRTLLNKLK